MSAFTDPCWTGKKQYPSEAQARSAARRYRRNYRADSRVYECDACEAWHLTTTYRTKKRRKWRIE